MIHKKTFTNDDLETDYSLHYTHNLGTQDVVPSWKDENGIYRQIGDLFQVIDDNNVILYCNAAIEGTNTLYIEYNEIGSSTTGRRLFELDETDKPADSMRLALGKASTPSINIDLADFYDLLMTKLTFLKKSYNLADLTNVATARSNLSVYSQTQTDALLAVKAALYQAASGSVLGVANTSVYNPTTKYNPAVLRNIINLGFKLLLSGQINKNGNWLATNFLNTDILTLSEISSEQISTGTYKITHQLGSSDYYILAEAIGDNEAAVGIKKIYKYKTYFTLHTSDDSGLNDCSFNFFMFQLNSYLADE